MPQVTLALELQNQAKSEAEVSSSSPIIKNLSEALVLAHQTSVGISVAPFVKAEGKRRTTTALSHLHERGFRPCPCYVIVKKIDISSGKDSPPLSLFHVLKYGDHLCTQELSNGKYICLNFSNFFLVCIA